MQKFDHWQMPDGEAHLPEWMRRVNRRVHGRLTYQYGKYEAALEHCKQRRAAIDIGAHVGLWSYFMAMDFNKLYAFEPMAAHQECWRANMNAPMEDRPGRGFNGAPVLFPFALGAAPGRVTIETRTPGSSGDTGVVPGMGGSIEMRTLDSFDLQDIDFIKIDCEGYEANVLTGARETLERCRPCVIVEQKRDHSEKYGLEKQMAVAMLIEMGAVLRAETSGDYILSWD